MSVIEHTTQRELPLFDAAASEAARRAGMEKAATNKASLLKHARKVAKRLAEGGEAISADDVAEALQGEGISVFALGSAAGSLFRESCWEWTGAFVKSRRTHAHSNLLRVWKLK